MVKWFVIYEGSNCSGVFHDFEDFDTKEEALKLKERYENSDWCNIIYLAKEVK